MLIAKIGLNLLTGYSTLYPVVFLDREKLDTFKFVKNMNELLKDGGLFLVSGSIHAHNVMTIGWGLLGTMWAKPVFVTAVRHSRYTYKLMEEARSWTICLPTKDMKAALEFCGTKSGRNYDKFKECKLTAKKGVEVDAPYIEECPIHIECTTVFKTDMKPGQLEEGMEKSLYKTKDFHMLYFGQVNGVYAVHDAGKKTRR